MNFFIISCGLQSGAPHIFNFFTLSKGIDPGGPILQHEGPHYGLRKNLRDAKRGTSLQLKNSFAVLIDLIFAARLTQFLFF